MRNDDKIRSMMLAAGVGQSLWHLNLPQFHDIGNEIRKYLLTELLHDLSTGVCISVYGKADIRVPLFNALAKEATLVLSTGCKLVTLRKLCSIIEYGEEDELFALRSARLLLIKNFYDDTIDCPYTFSQRSFIENFLTTQIVDHRVGVGLSTSAPLDKAVWWSGDFRSELKTNKFVSFYAK